MRRKKTEPAPFYGEPARASQVAGLLFPDQLAVEVDIVEDNHAGARFRAIIQNQVNALHLASGRDGGNRLGGIELEPFPPSSRGRLGGAASAADFVDNLVGRDDHKTRALRRALTALTNVVPECRE